MIQLVVKNEVGPGRFCIMPSDDTIIPFEPWHEISNNLVCETSKGLDQPAHICRLIRAFSGRLNIL